MANNFSRLPYEACLIPNLPEEIQNRVRDLTIYVVLPLDMLLATMAFIFNALICLSVARIKSLQRPSLLMLCSLSITDLTYALFLLYLTTKTILKEHMCIGDLDRGDTAVIILCGLTTLGALAVISRDRYLAVIKPIWYRNHIDTSRAIKMSCIPWIISVVMTLVHMVYVAYNSNSGKKKHLVYSIHLVYYCICFVIITSSYLGIYFKKAPTVEIREMHAVMEKEKKSTAAVRLILLTFLLTFVPALLSPIVLGLTGVENVGSYRPFLFLLFVVDAVANPLLNFGRNKDIRRAIRGLLNCFQHVEQQQQQQELQQQHQQQQHQQ